MTRYVYYDRRDISGTETQFFSESRSKATGKQFQTNMELDAQFPVDFTIHKIVVLIPPQLGASTTAKDATIDDQIQTLISEGVIEIQVGTGRVYYIPLASALGGVPVAADLEYTLGTSADGSYYVFNIQGLDGVDFDLSVPARTDFKFFIKTSTSVTLSNVKVLLYGEEAG